MFWDDHNEDMKDPVYRKAFEEARAEIQSLLAEAAEDWGEPVELPPKLSEEARAILNGPNPPKLKVTKDHLFPREGS